MIEMAFFQGFEEAILQPWISRETRQCFTGTDPGALINLCGSHLQSQVKNSCRLSVDDFIISLKLISITNEIFLITSQVAQAQNESRHGCVTITFEI